MSISRPWLALVLALFCLPLFVGLGRTDVGHDEAIYTFAVDRILEIGDWLEPKSSPHEDAAFLEKPPLKFWIVALPIRLGILPHNEFGIRFWDALFGGLAFAYVFAVGSRLAGPVCGSVAALLLFVHWPLLFEHGLRSNNMEAPLLLSYCGGLFHFIEWARAASADPASRTQGRRHAIAVGLYFVLGFMTKFVAAVFLPMIIGAAALMFRSSRVALARAWRDWLWTSALAVALIAPWFVYANVRFGWYFWEVILAEHVYTRFRTYLNPLHVQPWPYYFTEMFHRFGDSGSQWLVVAGLAVLVFQSVRRRWLEATVVVLWFAIPVGLISFGTSKLYHYAYPFLPPLALAAGYLAALVVMLAPVPIARILRRWRRWLAGRLPAVERACSANTVRKLLIAVTSIAALVAAISILYGPIRLSIGETVAFRSSGVVRPAVVLLLFGVLAGIERRASRVVVVLLVLSALPIQAYRDQFPRLALERHPMRTAIECVQGLESQLTPAPGLYLDVPGEFISHPLYYYFRRLRPWQRVDTPNPGGIGRILDDSTQWKPMLVWDATYQQFMKQQTSRPTSPPMVALPDVVLLLPGPYAACATEERRAGRLPQDREPGQREAYGSGSPGHGSR